MKLSGLVCTHTHFRLWCITILFCGQYVFFLCMLLGHSDPVTPHLAIHLWFDICPPTPCTFHSQPAPCYRANTFIVPSYSLLTTARLPVVLNAYLTCLPQHPPFPHHPPCSWLLPSAVYAPHTNSVEEEVAGRRWRYSGGNERPSAACTHAHRSLALRAPRRSPLHCSLRYARL